MLLSTAIPIVIAAIVIVIISNGIFTKPITPKTKKAAIKFGIIPINDRLIFLNKTQKGHYDKKPKPFTKFKTFNYYRNTNLDYRQGLKELINIVKSNKF